MFNSVMLQILFAIVLYSCLCFAKYSSFSDLETSPSISDWQDQISGTYLGICQKSQDIKCFGKKADPYNKIYWQKKYSLPKTSRLNIFIEYQITGVWNDYRLKLFANNLLVYSQLISFIDTNRDCNSNFLYESYMYVSFTQDFDQLVLEFQVNKVNVGLFIQNIIINYRTQSGKNEIIPFFGFLPNDFDINNNPTCRIDSGLEFFQYFCKCSGTQVYQGNQCQPTCDNNYLYDKSTNECYFKQNCDACSGKNTVMKCNAGFYLYQGTGPATSECLQSCPQDYYSDQITMTCLEMQDYLSEMENQGYPVDHYFFYKSTSDFFHFFQYNDIFVQVTSTPKKVKERSFIFHKDKFVAGSFETFKSQTIILQIKVKHSQHKMRFRAIGHFIDFQPSNINIYINGVLQPQSQLIPSTSNEQKIDQDYITSYDFYWVRTEFYPVNYNNIVFIIDQPLQNGQYQGYFYLEDIHIFQFRCVTNCEACFKIDYCTPCLNPANKQLSDCSCLTGYVMQNDICIACPTYCSTCSTPDVCDDCNSSTKKMSPPACDICPDQYYVVPNQDDCQSCIIGCKQCNSALSCEICLSGYFRNSEQKCVVQCEDGYFNNGIDDPVCSLCDSNCLTCENTANSCTSCLSKATLVNQHCYSCPENYYLSGIICEPCILGCQICKSGLTCELCQESYFLQINTGICVSECAIHYFGNLQTRTCDVCDSTCLNCLSDTSSDCISCAKGLVLNIGQAMVGYCSQNCLTGYYPKGDHCVKCWKGCNSCIDSTQACLVCAPKYFREKQSENCYEICPSGYYNNVIGFVCSVCDLSCKTCNGSTESNCLSCASSTSLYQNQCVQGCPDGYGSINSVCQECTPNCKQCFGVAQNQCLKCSKGYYFLQNQCFLKCPQSFIGIRPQYICKCIYDICVSCNVNQYFYDNHCCDECPLGLYGYNGICLQCDRSCETCFGEGPQSCNSCKIPLIQFQNQCVPKCIGNTYYNSELNQCQYCHDTCLACIGPTENDCTACLDNLLTADNTCTDSCPSNQYLVSQEKRCIKCDQSCLTCFGNSNKNCLTCKNFISQYECVDVCPANTQLNANKISCIPGQPGKIDKCSYQCATCLYIPRFCTACYGNRAANPPHCDCGDGYFDDGSNGDCQKCANKCLSCSIKSDQCLKCKGDRLLPLCECPKYYYDDGISVNCSRCQDNCETCSQYGCISCLNNRIEPPNCICPDGYYEAYLEYCQECAKQCLTCSVSEMLCHTCSSIRENPPVCNCPSGYFQNSNEDCQPCDQTCIECDIKGCLTCFGNREGPDFGICHCAPIGIGRLNVGSVYCTDCNIGVPYFGLNEEFTGFYIDFGAQVEFSTDVDQNDICYSIFETQSLQKLGTDPSCDAQLNVLFGQNPSIEVGDVLQLKPKFILKGCLHQFSSVKIMHLSIPSTINLITHKPVIEFYELLEPVNQCSPIEIKFKKKYYNGMQKLKILQWKKILPTDLEPVIDQILDDAVQYQKENLSFPRKIFQEKVPYKFSVTFKSFAHLSTTQYIVFTPASYSTVVFGPIDSENEFRRTQAIKINCEISYYNCQEENPPTEALQFGVSIRGNDYFKINGTISENLFDGFQQSIELSFESFYFNFSNPYTLVFYSKLIRTDYIQEFINEVNIYIVPQPLTLTIEGGNRLLGCIDDLFLNASIIDKDLTEEEKSAISYNCYWSCTDIQNLQPCQDVHSYTLQFDNKCEQLIQERFSPYSVMIFQVSIVKDQEQYSSKISVQVVEIDLPQLKVIGPDITQSYNYYDEFIFSMIYSGVNPDCLMYAGAIIYDQIIQATFEIHYLEFKFKLINYFTDLTPQKGNNLRLRLSVYDPRYIMPSLNSQILYFNIPPSNCQIDYQNIDFIEFLDQLNLSVRECQDTPLLFSLGIFPNVSIFQSNLLRSNFYDYIELIPPSEQNNFNFTIPYFNIEPIVLLLSIQDSKGAITNITKQLKIKQYLNLTFDTLKDYINHSETVDQMLLAYQVVAIRLTSMEDSGYLEELFKTALLFDKNQSLLCNQTEKLYQTLAIIVGQNCSLVHVSNDQLLYQLNYRISIAWQHLHYFFEQQKLNQISSAQNLEKSTFIKQLHIFLNILSSFIKYRVRQQSSSTDVQQQYANIIGYLQKISVANEPIYQISTRSGNLNFGNLTSKMIYETIGTTLENDNHFTDLKAQPKFYDYSLVRYTDNPFYVSGGFPKNSSGYQAVDPRMTIKNSTTNDTKLSTSINYQFPLNKSLQMNVTQKCIVQVNSTVWSADVCKTVTKGNEIICQCDTLSPTSIMESLNVIEDKIGQLYTLDSLAAFLQFPFYKTFIFYFYLLITGAYITLTFWGMKVDQKIFAKIQQESAASENQKQDDQITNRKTQNKNFENDQEKEILFTRSIFKQSIESQRIRLIYQLKSTNSDSCPQISSQKSEKEVIPENQARFSQVSSKNSQDDLPLMKSAKSIQVEFKSDKDERSPSKDQISSQKQIKQIIKVRPFIKYLKFFHQILQVIYKDDHEKPRALRSTILYTSIIGSLTILLIFNQPQNLSVIIALNLITAPMNKIYQVMLEKLLAHKKKTMRALGATLMIFVGGFMSYNLLIGLSLLGSVEVANKWAYIFITSFSVDNLIYCPFQLVIQYCVHGGLLSIPALHKLLNILIDEKGKEFLRELFENSDII